MENNCIHKHFVEGAVRASRAVEGVNNVVRMHEGRHRCVSQGRLDLKRFYWNCERFERANATRELIKRIHG